METIKLKHFLVVAEVGSLSKAADRLGISAGGLSKSISSLEIEIGFKLFQAQGRGLEITADGKWMYLKAQEVLKLTDEMQSGPQESRGSVAIGLPEVLAVTCTSHFAKAIAGEIHFTQCDSVDLVEQITNGDLDFGFSFVPLTSSAVRYESIGSLIFNAYAHTSLLQTHTNQPLPYSFPTLKMASNPLDYKNRDGWPHELTRDLKYGVSHLSAALELLRAAQAAVYMPDFVARFENMKTEERAIVKVRAHASALTRRNVYFVIASDREETATAKKACKVIRQLCSQDK